MRYKTLGSTGMKVSEVTIGTWAMGGYGWGEVDRKQAILALHQMVDNGANFLDSANAYNYGESERVVGEAIKEIRDKVFVSTKGGIYHMGIHAVKDGSEENMFKQCEESLKNLGLDYIDLYFVHWPDYNVPFEETFTAMEKLKSQGKIKHIGVSNFTLDQVFEAEKYAKIDVVQPPYAMVNRSAERFMKWVHDHGIGVMTYGSLGGGILTGAYRELPKFDGYDFRLVTYDSFVEPKFSRVMELLKTLDKIAEKHDVPVAQVAINWNLAKDFVDTAIIGVRNRKEADENCACMDWALSGEEMAIIDKAIEDTLGKPE